MFRGTSHSENPNGTRVMRSVKLLNKVVILLVLYGGLYLPSGQNLPNFWRRPFFCHHLIPGGTIVITSLCTSEKISVLVLDDKQAGSYLQYIMVTLFFFAKNFCLHLIHSYAYGFTPSEKQALLSFLKPRYVKLNFCYIFLMFIRKSYQIMRI